MKTIKTQVIIAICLLSIFVSCNKDEIPPIPELTPSGSFSMEFDDFNNPKSTNLLIENWLYSSLSVSFFSIVSTANVAVPAIAYTESFNHIPIYIGDNTWQWSYEFIAIGATYTAKLNGINQQKNNVKWEMYISKTGSNSFTDFLWFEGTTTDSTAANWQIYENPASPSAVLDIEWESSPDHSQSTLKYTYITKNSENTNSYIQFGKRPENNYDRFYTIYLNNEKASISVEWNSVLKNGRVKSPNHYFDENWHCWNEYLFDDWCN